MIEKNWQFNRIYDRNKSLKERLEFCRYTLLIAAFEMHEFIITREIFSK